jgi:two-component system response regulator PilR (NtrC family)
LSPGPRILLVDDEQGMLEVCAEALSSLNGAELVLENVSRKALERLESEHFDLLVTDLKMPGVDGVALLRTARASDPNLAAVVLTAFPTVETAVETMKLGAADYIEKPFRPDELLAVVGRLLESQKLRDENRLLARQVERTHLFDEIVGKSDVMQGVFESIQRIAAADADVLILGETGTGKELVARAIHRRSQRAKQRFVPVDCGAIPDNLLESELFGHERGAFTGAESRNLGLIEYASSGTFFLDEVAELPLRLQAKLLRVLQERKVRRVGGKDEIAVDVRVVAATSRDLQQEIRERRFREDLFYRINVACVELPPLRRRAEDVPLLVPHFLDRNAGKMGRNGVTVEPEALEVLCRYSWPGNVRELQNLVKRLLAMTSGDVIRVDDLPDALVDRASDNPPPSGDSGDGFLAERAQRTAEFEREYLSRLLGETRGDVPAAAREARLPRGTLYRLLKKYGLAPADFRS